MYEKDHGTSAVDLRLAVDLRMEMYVVKGHLLDSN